MVAVLACRRAAAWIVSARADDLRDAYLVASPSEFSGDGGRARAAYAEGDGADEREVDTRHQRHHRGNRNANHRRDSGRAERRARVGKTTRQEDSSRRGDDRKIAGRRLPAGTPDHAGTIRGRLPVLSKANDGTGPEDGGVLRSASASAVTLCWRGATPPSWLARPPQQRHCPPTHTCCAPLVGLGGFPYAHWWAELLSLPLLPATINPWITARNREPPASGFATS